MRKPKCQVLDKDGKRCLKVSAGWKQYHGDNELYSFKEPPVDWVTVRMCAKHLEAFK